VDVSGDGKLDLVREPDMVCDFDGVAPFEKNDLNTVCFSFRMWLPHRKIVNGLSL
jgi:hypothetical protein